MQTSLKKKTKKQCYKNPTIYFLHNKFEPNPLKIESTMAIDGLFYGFLLFKVTVAILDVA